MAAVEEGNGECHAEGSGRQGIVGLKTDPPIVAIQGQRGEPFAGNGAQGQGRQALPIGLSLQLCPVFQGHAKRIVGGFSRHGNQLQFVSEHHADIERDAQGSDEIELGALPFIVCNQQSLPAVLQLDFLARDI